MANIEDIVREEWLQFQLVNNEGGRASCQDDWQQFNIMRTSQFMAWPQEVLDSYYNDLMQAKASDRNLLFEKYAFMMRETAPDRFEAVKGALPELSEKKAHLIEYIVEAQVKWAEEFQEKYPNYAKRGRVIRAKDAQKWDTSIETYQRGELSSYSEQTVELYAAYVAECLEKGINLAENIRDNMARMYGYESKEDAERLMS